VAVGAGDVWVSGGPEALMVTVLAVVVIGDAAGEDSANWPYPRL
jgi:hypothetical protein